jgi:hypothetical protein
VGYLQPSDYPERKMAEREQMNYQGNKAKPNTQKKKKKNPEKSRTLEIDRETTRTE